MRDVICEISELLEFLNTNPVSQFIIIKAHDKASV